MTVACLNEKGKVPVVRDRLEKWVRAGTITLIWLEMRWDGIGSRGQVVRWDLERSLDSITSVMVEKLVKGQAPRGGVSRVCGGCRMKLSLILSILSVKRVAKSSAEMRMLGGGSRGQRMELKVLNSYLGL